MWELRFHKPCGVVKKKKKQTEGYICVETYQKVSKLRRVMIKAKQGNQKPIVEFVKTWTFLKAGEMAVL